MKQEIRFLASMSLTFDGNGGTSCNKPKLDMEFWASQEFPAETHFSSRRFGFLHKARAAWGGRSGQKGQVCVMLDVLAFTAELQSRLVPP